MKSTHKAEVVEVHLEPHLNSDNLSIVKIGGYQVVVRTEDWLGRDIGVYIQPDSIVDVSRPEFAFLAERGDVKDGKIRIRACKFRGALSYGLLIPAPKGAKLGDDLAEFLGVDHYEPETHYDLQGENIKAPPGVWPKYDIESIRSKLEVFQEGEPVWVTEKIHGQNQRVVFTDGRLYVGSRTLWKKETDKCKFWAAVKSNPGIFEFCKANPDWSVYLEGYGQVQDLRYGRKDIDGLAFDIRRPDGSFVGPEEFISLCEKFGIRTVPILAQNIPFNWEEIQKYAEGNSLVPGANNVKEGCVIRPQFERWNEKIGRVILKLVGFGYLSRKNK